MRSHSIKQAATYAICGLLPCLCLAQQRSEADAEKLAYNFISDNSMSLGQEGLKLNLTSSLFLQNKGTHREKEAFYVFSSSSKDKGFIIISGDERMPTVLAYSDESDFEIDNIPSNVQYWLDCYSETYNNLNFQKNETSSHISMTTDHSGEVEPLLGDNRWDQDSPYNLKCPSVKNEKCLTGCVATAMAQVMKYHGHPNIGMGVVNYRTQTNGINIQYDLSTTPFRWENMLDTYNGNYSSSQAYAVADLMFACGVSVKMDYGTSSQGGSGAYQYDLIPAFIDNFSYDKDASFMARNYCSNEDWHRILIHELNEGRPVNYGGQSARDGGHSFVLDGYLFHEDSNNPFYHVNWGWNGACNGYYQITDLHPVENGHYATAGAFNSSQQLTMGVMPDDGVDNGMYNICTPNLYVSSSQVKPGSTVHVYSASMENFSYKTFSGTIHVALVSEENASEIILGENSVQTLRYMQGQNNLSLEITIPSNLSDGQYVIQLRSKKAGAEEYNHVYSRTYPKLTVSSSGNVEPIVVREVLLGSSELEVSDTTILCLNIYEVQNLMDAPFIGDMRMVLADTSGKQLSVFGDSIQPGELSMYDVQEFPLKLKGTLIGDWEDGNYRVYVGARLINTYNYVYLSYFDITQPGMTSQELFLNAQIKDDILHINSHSYEIIPTSVTSVWGGESCSFFSSTGIRREGLLHGINIVRKPDGKVIKMFSK